jgi:hypothetical protein
LTNASQRILDGQFFDTSTNEASPELREFIGHQAIPDVIKQTPLISKEITLEEYHRRIKRWKEKTSTSPSGRHLGVYRSLLNHPSISADMVSMLNVVARTGIIPSRWCRAVSVLLEKDPGAPNINRLRVIHLFEADYNLFLKIFWAKRLVQRGESTGQFGEAQQGSRPRRKANDAVMLKRLSYDLSRILRTNMGTFDNDAKSCYDRIINGIAMLAARRLGMPTTTVATHAGVLSQMKYTIKTAYGISERYIASTESAFLYVTGQGSGASPAVWLTLSTVLFSALQALTIWGMVFTNPSGSIRTERHSDSFVDDTQNKANDAQLSEPCLDDTQNGVNDAFLPAPWSLQDLSNNLAHTSQSWERLLFCTGGSLELSKCFYYLIYWKWIDGLPTLYTKQELIEQAPSISLTSGSNAVSHPISLRDPTEATKHWEYI